MKIKDIEKLDLLKVYYTPTLYGDYIQPPTEYELLIARKINEIIEILQNGSDDNVSDRD